MNESRDAETSLTTSTLSHMCVRVCDFFLAYSIFGGVCDLGNDSCSAKLSRKEVYYLFQLSQKQTNTHTSHTQNELFRR